MLYKNTAGQKIGVFAYTASTGAAKTGDAANITCYESIGFAAADQLDDVNPTELDATNMPGWYVFDLTQAETNGEVLIFAPKSSTSGVVLDQIQVFTEASVAQTGDSYARLGAPAGASVSADIADVEGKVDDLESRLGTPSDLGSGATVAANLADIEAQTDDIGAAGAGLTAIPWNAAWDAEVESEVDDALGGGTGTALTAIPWNAAWDAEVQSEATDALNAYDPPTKAELDSAVAALATSAALATVDGIVDAILVDTGTTLPAAIAAISAGMGSGTGTYTDTVTDGTNPLDGVRVQLSTDSAKANPVYQAYTDALGVFLMYPDPGTYYVWFEKAGYDFSAVNGTEVTVT